MGENPELADLISKRHILKIIECSVCEKVPFPPIYMCTGGHSICKRCKPPKLQKCPRPLCEKSYSKTRNYQVEQMVLASPHRCAYKDEGCTIAATIQALRDDDHIKKCQFRSFMCPGLGRHNCGLTIKLSQAIEHFSATHKSVKPNSERCLTLPFSFLVDDKSKLKEDIAWRPSLIELDGKTFLGEIYTREDFIYWTFFCIGTEEEAGQYEVEIIFSSEKNNSIKHRWNFTVQPIIKCEELRDGNRMEDVVIPSCSIDDLKKMAVCDDVDRQYEFQIEHKVPLKCPLLKY